MTDKKQSHTYASHGGDVKMVTIVTVTGVSFIHTDTAAVLTPLKDTTFL